MLTRASDVLNVVNPGQTRMYSDAIRFETTPIEGLRGRILELLSASPIDVDTLVRETQATPDAVLGLVMEMEISGQIARHAGGKFSRLA